MDAVSAPRPSASCSPTTCSRTGSAAPARATTRERWRAWWATLRRNFLVPIPSFESFEALNAHLERRCLERMDARLRGHSESIGQRMERDLEALLPLPPVAYDACEKRGGPGQFPVPGAVPHQRLLGAGGLRPSGCPGTGLRGPGGDQLRLGGHCPALPLL